MSAFSPRPPSSSSARAFFFRSRDRDGASVGATPLSLSLIRENRVPSASAYGVETGRGAGLAQ